MPAVTGPIETVNPSNTYPTHREELGQGGYRTVADNAARDAISVDRRKAGMLVKTLNDQVEWELLGDLTTWRPSGLPGVPVATFATVAAMKASLPDLPTGVTVNTRGYYVELDGGGADYWVDPADNSSADDGVFTHVAASGARIKLLHSNKVDILQAGATRYTGEGQGLYGDYRNSATVIGTGDFSIFVEFVNPTWPATQIGLMEVTDQANVYNRSVGLYGASSYFSILLRSTTGLSAVGAGTASSFVGANPFNALPAGSLQRVVLTRTAGTLKVYINGVDTTGSFSFTSGFNNWSGADIVMGAAPRYHLSYTVAGPFYFPAPVSKFRVWNSVLSAGQAADPTVVAGALVDYQGTSLVAVDSGPKFNTVGAKLRVLGGGEIQVPPGKYLVETQVRVFAKTAISGIRTSPAYSVSGVANATKLISYALTSSVLLAQLADCTDEVNLTPRTYNGETVTNRNHGGAVRNLSITAIGAADCFKVDQIANFAIEDVSLNPSQGYALNVWGSNGLVVEKLSGVGSSFARGIVVDFTADCVFSDNNFGGAAGPVAWIRGNAMSVSNCQWWNTLAQTQYRKTATFSGTNLTVTGHRFRDGDMVTFETSGTLPTPLDAITAYYVKVVNSNTIQVNSARGTLLVGGTALSLSGGSGTLTVGPGPTTNVLLDNVLGNSFVGCRFDQSIAHSLVAWNATETSFSGVQFIDSWWAATSAGMQSRRAAVWVRGAGARQQLRFGSGCSFAAIRKSPWYVGTTLSWCNQDVEEETPGRPSSYSSGFDVALNNYNGALCYRKTGRSRSLPFLDFEVPAITVLSKARTSNVATLICEFPHNLTTGALVRVGSSPDSSFNTATDVSVTVVDAITFTYANTGTDFTAAADTALRAYPVKFAYLGGENASGQEYRFRLGGGEKDRTLALGADRLDVEKTSDGAASKLFLAPNGAGAQFGTEAFSGPSALYTFAGSGTASYSTIFGNESATAGRVRIDFGGTTNNRTVIVGGTEVACALNGGGAATLLLQGINGLGGAVLVGGSTVEASAVFQIDSTTKGFLPPRMTKAQRNAIASPINGLVIYQTDSTPGIRFYEGGAWNKPTVTADP